MNDKLRKGLSIGFFILFLLVFALVTILFWKPLMNFFEEPETFRLWVEEKGWSARILFVGMVVVQVFLALIPGEPLEIAAGFAFGSVEGTILCLIGIAVGSALVFLLVRLIGVKLVTVFFPIEKIHSLRILQNSRRFEAILFLLMFIPGTPKDLISYFVGLTEMKLGRWLLLTSVARIPSVVTSTIGGNAVGEGEYLYAALVFAITFLISVAGILVYDRITKRKKV